MHAHRVSRAGEKAAQTPAQSLKHGSDSDRAFEASPCALRRNIPDLDGSNRYSIVPRIVCIRSIIGVLMKLRVI